MSLSSYNKADVSKLVKHGRITKGYTQQEFADLTRISLRSVQRIENGDVLPRLYTLKILAQQLEFELDEINEAATDEIKQQTRKLNKPRKLILSVGSLLLLILLTGAFLAQSSKFPETTFETLLLFAGVSVAYVVLLYKIWK